MDLFPDKEISFNLPENLEQYGMTLDETFNSVVEKYFSQSTEKYPLGVKERVLGALSLAKHVGTIGEVYEPIWNLNKIQKVPLGLLEQEAYK
jgi:hypothetical protein